MSQVLTTPSESLEIAMPSFVCRVIDLIGAKVDFELHATGSIEKVPICQNLTDWSLDAEMRDEEEENVREVMVSACPVKVSMG